MEVQQLIDAARLRLDDSVEPYHYPDDALILHAAEAEAEAAMRASLLYDDSSAWLALPLAAGQDTYAIDPRVWRIDCAWLVEGSIETPLVPTGVDQLRPEQCLPGLFGGYAGPTTGKPQCFAQVGSTVRLWPVPAAPTSATLRLAVYRLPIEALEDGGDEPEIPVFYHMGLVDWMLYRAWSNQDSEIFAPERSAQAAADFERRFGERPSADVHRKRTERRRVTAPYGGF